MNILGLPQADAAKYQDPIASQTRAQPGDQTTTKPPATTLEGSFEPSKSHLFEVQL